MKKWIASGLLSMSLCLNTAIAAETETAAPTTKEWTFMVFLNGDNNLDNFGVKDVEEMKKVGSNENLNIVVQWDRSSGKPCNRLFIEKGKATNVGSMGEVDMGDVKVFNDFVKWGITQYPAKHYAVVLWNHGSGWDKNNRVAPVIRGISYDDQSGNNITTNQMTESVTALAKFLGRKLDIVAFDACLMNMVEVAYAIKDHVDIQVGSEETEPGDGWPYTEVLAPMAKGGMDSEAVAKNIVDAYDKSYEGKSQDTTQSYLRLNKIAALSTALDNLGKVIPANSKEVKLALQKAQSFSASGSTDLGHLLDLLSASIKDSRSTALLNAAKAANNAVIGHSASNSDSMKDAQGLAIYFPSAGYAFSSQYLDLNFAKETKWDDTLNAYFEAIKATESDL